MNITFLQGILLSLFVFIAAWDARWETFFIFRPIVVSFFAGIILGDVQLGLQTGAVAELAYLGMVTVGGTVPPNPLIAGLMTTVLAYKTGVDPKTALGLSLPFALLMQWITIAAQSAFSWFNIKLEQAAEENNTEKFTFYVFFPEFIMTSIYAIVTFLSTYAMQNVIKNFVNIFPEFIAHGFEIAGGLLPGIGLAILLKTMLTKYNFAYLLIGFIMVTFLDLGNVLPIAVVGVAIGLLIYFNEKSKEEGSIEGAGENEGI